MTWLDVSLKGKLMMTLESAGVVKENPTVKKDRELGEYREIYYGYKEPTSKVIAINKFDVHFDVRKSQYYLSDDIRIVLDNWLFHKITLPGNWNATTLMSREFKILIGGEEVARPSKE